VKERGVIWNKYTDGVISRVQTMRLDPNNKKQRHAPNPLKIFFCRIEYDAVEQACLLHRSICRQSPLIIMRAVNSSSSDGDSSHWSSGSLLEPEG
jgi:hypothetical protein